MWICAVILCFIHAASPLFIMFKVIIIKIWFCKTRLKHWFFSHNTLLFFGLLSAYTYLPSRAFQYSLLALICLQSQLSVQQQDFKCRETCTVLFLQVTLYAIPVSCLPYLFPANNPSASDAARCFSASDPPLKRKSENYFPVLTGLLWGVWWSEGSDVM